MADEAIRERYRIDEILRRVPKNRGEFFVDFAPWTEDVDGWKRSARETFAESSGRVLIRTIWDNPQDRDSRVLIDIVECESAADAVEALADRLEGNQLAELPEGPEALGLGSFQHPEFVPPALFYVHANLAITVTSFGRKRVDVTDIARRLDTKLGERPTSTTAFLRAYPMLRAEPHAKPGDRVILRLNLPARRREDSYLKLFVTGGTIARRDGELVTHSKDAGRIEIEAFLVEPGPEAFAATSTILVDRP